MLTLTIEASGYIMANLGFRLLGVLSLPLVSYGNAATIINLGHIGLMLSAFRNDKIIKDQTLRAKHTGSFVAWGDHCWKLVFNKLIKE